MLKKEVVSALVVFLISLNSNADEKIDNSKFYAGLKGAYSDFSSIDWDMIGSGSWDVEDTLGYGIYTGYKFSDGWSIEFEYLNFETETKDPEFNACNYTTLTCVVSKADYESDSYSIYGAYRTSGKVYFKGRVGYSYQESEFSKSSYGLPTSYDNGVSGSVGVGITFNRLLLEAEYTYTTEYLSNLSIGAALSF